MILFIIARRSSIALHVVVVASAARAWAIHYVSYTSLAARPSRRRIRPSSRRVALTSCLLPRSPSSAGSKTSRAPCARRSTPSRPGRPRTARPSLSAPASARSDRARRPRPRSRARRCTDTATRSAARPRSGRRSRPRRASRRRARCARGTSRGRRIRAWEDGEGGWGGSLDARFESETTDAGASLASRSAFAPAEDADGVLVQRVRAVADLREGVYDPVRDHPTDGGRSRDAK